MHRRALGPVAAALALSIACRSTSGQPQQNPEDDRKKIEELQREVARLRAELIRARIEILDFKLRDARAARKPDEELRLLLHDGLGSEFPEIQQHAFMELLNLAPEQRKRAVASVLDRWRTADEKFRVLAVPFLFSSGEERAVATVLDAARDPSPEVRRAVAVVLATSTGEKAIETLVGMLKDSHGEVRGAAVDALTALKREASVRPLLEFLRDEKTPELREKAVRALGEIGSREAVPDLIDLLPVAHLRWDCISSLGKIGDPRAVPALRRYLDPEEAVNIRQIAIRSLGRLKDADSVFRFESMLLSEEPPLREAAADAVGRIGDRDSLTRSLLPAYATEGEEGVRGEIWKSVLLIAGRDLDLLDRLAAWLISRGCKAEIEDVVKKVIEMDGPGRAGQIGTILEKISAYTFGQKLWMPSLEHHRALLKYAPQNWEAWRRTARCYLELGDAEGALKTLNEAAENARADTSAYWRLKEDALAALAKLNDPARTVDETYGLLAEAPPAGLRPAIQKAYDEAAARLVELLRSADEATRKKAVADAKKLGKKILVPLAAALEAAPAPGIIEAGNAIAGTALDPTTTDAAKIKETAGVWRDKAK
ncbi:MAG: HEAT repeat domain-containing protein [Planctomycetes bacterium]|nr:HEAT repeat domain-containing protein [Planctomycetota bacterium]